MDDRTVRSFYCKRCRARIQSTRQEWTSATLERWQAAVVYDLEHKEG